MTVSAVIVAAGKGTRMNHDIRKQYLLLAGRPILTHTLMVFEACEQIDQIVVVIPEDDFDFCKKTVINPLNLKEKICLVRGGTRRQDSVYNGLASLDPKTEIVVIHDGVRPFVTVENLSACILAARATGVCILGIPAGDTVKRVNQYGIVEATLAR
ncbi:MAG: 2-C-methyl-D-erythritol 4-phosphate cytidylyltransferase, partial [Proteobacteria bacterium]|nr:2-C-methyl-D-erythritol 4-phosphate cytidylyltransferase [Pseudomonadota bacterium]